MNMILPVRPSAIMVMPNIDRINGFCLPFLFSLACSIFCSTSVFVHSNIFPVGKPVTLPTKRIAPTTIKASATTTAIQMAMFKNVGIAACNTTSNEPNSVSSHIQYIITQHVDHIRL